MYYCQQCLKKSASLEPKEIWKNKRYIQRGIKDNLCAGVTITVTPTTSYFLQESITFLIEQGFTNIRINFVQEAQYIWSEREFTYLEEILPRLLQKARNADVTISPLETVQKMYLSKDDHDSRYLRCGIGYNKITVDPHGNLVPCLRFAESNYDVFMIGTANTNTIHNGVINYLRELKNSKKLKCSTCVYRDTCLTYCPYIALEYGDIYSPPYHMCRFNELFHTSALSLLTHDERKSLCR
jgi:radical SAM protein with 4Fe4S-binding SPASM domain